MIQIGAACRRTAVGRGLLFPLALCFFLSACAVQEPAVGTTFLMDTVFEYKFYGANGEKAAQAVIRALNDFEQRVSLYVDGSEISLLNANAGKAYAALSPDTFDLLSQCVSYSRESEGTFDVTVAPLTKLWDITGSSPHVPADEEIRDGLALVGYQDILLDAQGSRAMLAREGQSVDLGGIAKGYACGLARQVALENGVKKGYVSIGGNLMVIGKKSRTEQFLFGVRDPRGSANDYLAVVSLPDSTMATSGDYERYFEQDGKRYHHILDPATGRPAQTDLISVSVISEDGGYADYMSTYLFIKGREFAVSHLNQFDCGLILIDHEKRVYVSDSLKAQFQFSDPTGTYRYEEAK